MVRLLAVPLPAVLLLAVPASADETRSPRVTVEIDGMSVVLVAAGQRIDAYVDQIADNAPVPDAELELELRGSGTRLQLQQAAPGLFVAPFVPTGRDVFLVTLRRLGATGQAVAELPPEVAPAAAAAEAPPVAWSGHLPWLLVGLSALTAVLIGAFRPALRAWALVGGRHEANTLAER
jgi:hypothetical protein